MKRNGLYKAAACGMIGIVASLCAACGQKGTAKNLMVDIAPPKKEEVTPYLTDQFKVSTADFSVKLFQECAKKQENMMISPTSMLLAMSMTAQGAKGNTLLQMQKAMYGGTGEEESCLGLLALRKELFVGKNTPVKEANSIWFRNAADSVKPKQEFLQRNKAYLNSEVYEAKFDESTVKDINTWVSDKTDGHIKEIVKEIDQHDIMHLINTVSFDGKWVKPCEDYEVERGIFASLSGDRESVSYMNSMEEKYISDQKSQGIIKPYKNGYSFVAILPNKGVPIADYIREMTGESFTKLINDAKETSVITKIPKFKSEYSILANDVLYKIGMSDAFDTNKADFSGICGEKGDIYISSVLQKTFIEVDEKGTKASAATDVTMKDTAAAMPEEPLKVELTRPFIYAIINDKTSLPIFMGMVASI